VTSSRADHLGSIKSPLKSPRQYTANATPLKMEMRINVRHDIREHFYPTFTIDETLGCLGQTRIRTRKQQENRIHVVPSMEIYRREWDWARGCYWSWTFRRTGLPLNRYRVFQVISLHYYCVRTTHSKFHIFKLRNLSKKYPAQK